MRPDALCPKMDKASGCLSTVERTIWDGDQVVAELRVDGGQFTTALAMECDANCQVARPTLEGRVLYTHGGGLDHPLDIIRLDTYSEVIVPVYSWRGRAVDGICVNASAFCTDFTWPARTESATFEDPVNTDPVYGGPVAWGGNQIDTQKDGSGLVYKRNRYYDPASGRFTQVDPIGLGGGLSAYGFGGGDQISFTDAFGLLGSQQSAPAQADSSKASPKDACNAYPVASYFRMICLREYAPGKSDSATKCAALCLAHKYEELKAKLGHEPNASESRKYLADHGPCYQVCGMTKTKFAWQLFTNAGGKGRGTDAPFCGYACAKVSGIP